MTRRSTPKAKIDEAWFPVRIRVTGPERGALGSLFPRVHEWLDQEVGRAGYALNSAGRGIEIETGEIIDASFLYFMNANDAVRFLSAFPTIALARLPSSAPLTRNPVRVISSG